VSVALTVAGSDSGGGAGIQADIKTFSALGVYGASVITAITAQNTVGVQGVLEVPTDMIRAQLDAVLSDLPVAAAKTGMLSSSEIIESVTSVFSRYGVDQLVVDPVMVAKSGDRLLQLDAVDAVRRLLLPIALIVTPNVPEAEVLAGMTIGDEHEREEAARRIHDMGPRWVIVKGGHLRGDAVDLVWDGQSMHRLSAPRIETTSTHGTGCTFSAAITALLVKGRPVLTAIEQAKEYLTGAIVHAEDLGHGYGPLNHHYRAQFPGAEHGS